MGSLRRISANGNGRQRLVVAEDRVSLNVAILAADRLLGDAVASVVARRSASALPEVFTEPAVVAHHVRSGGASDILLWYTARVRLASLETLRRHCGEYRLPLCVVTSGVADDAVEALGGYEPCAAILLRSQELSSRQLFRTLVQLYAGQAVISPEVLQRALRGVYPSERSRLFARLSDQELSALRLLSLGLTNREIATRLRCSKRRADRLVAGLLPKLIEGVKDPTLHPRTLAARIYLGFPACVPASSAA